MANEGLVNVTVRIKKDTQTHEKKGENKYDVSSKNYSGATQTIGGSWEEVYVGTDVTTPGVSFFRNHSETETILLGIDTDGSDVVGGIMAFARIRPGMPQAVQPYSANIFAKVEDGSGTADLEYFVPQE